MLSLGEWRSSELFETQAQTDLYIYVLYVLLIKNISVFNS